MTNPPTLMDRLRVERAVWTVDARIQDLPRRSRISRRRELRQNLLAATAEVGAGQAVRRLGDLRGLAAGYLDAEYGDVSRRPSWTATAVWIAVVDLAMLYLDHVSTAAFRAGVTAATPNASGTFHWTGVRYLISDATFHYSDGNATSDGGAWTPWAFVLMLGGAVIAGRLWRLVPQLRRRRELEDAGAGGR
jgi:hypothetical protein